MHTAGALVNLCMYKEQQRCINYVRHLVTTADQTGAKQCLLSHHYNSSHCQNIPICTRTGCPAIFPCSGHFCGNQCLRDTRDEVLKQPNKYLSHLVSIRKSTFVTYCVKHIQHQLRLIIRYTNYPTYCFAGR